MSGATYMGHPLCCAAGIANLEIVEREKLVERCAELGPYLQDGLATLLAHPIVGDVRGVGLVAGIEYVKDKETREWFAPAQGVAAQDPRRGLQARRLRAPARRRPRARGRAAVHHQQGADRHRRARARRVDRRRREGPRASSPSSWTTPRARVVWDSDGNEYIDAFASLWTVNVGHGRQEIYDAINEQAKKLAIYHIFQIANEPAIKLAAKVAEHMPGDLNHVFLTLGGGESVETAVKMARQYWRNKGKGTKYMVMFRDRSYHGTTMTSDERPGPHREPRQVRAAAARLHQARRALLLPLRLEQDLRRRLQDGVRHAGRARDRLLRRRERRHHARRDDDRHRRRDPAAARVLAHGQRDLQGQRRARHQRRGHHRLRPQRHLVRLRAVRLRPRPGHAWPRASRPATCRSAPSAPRTTSSRPSSAAPARPS